MIDRSRYCIFNSEVLDGAVLTGKYEFPKIPKVVVLTKPNRVIPFDRVHETHDKDTWMHFHVHDRRYERLYAKKDKYIPILQEFGGVFGLDHSIYRCLPLAERLYSTYENRVSDYWFAKNGILCVPNVSWGNQETFAYCCDGIEFGSSISVSTYGWSRSKRDKGIFIEGFYFVLDKLRPASVFNHGKVYAEVEMRARKMGIPFFQIPSHIAEVFAARGKEARHG